MDRNSITGLVLISLVLIGFYFINKPSAEQVEAMQRQRDSLERVEMLCQQELDAALKQQAEATPVALEAEAEATTEIDSIQLNNQLQRSEERRVGKECRSRRGTNQ